MKFKLIIDENAEEEIVATVHAPSHLTDQIEKLVLSEENCDFIIAKSEDGGIIRLAPTDIECITVIDRKVYAIDTNGDMHRLKSRLNKLEMLLPPHFIYINKSTLANIRKIDRIKASFNGSLDAVFKSGYKDYISRRCFKNLKQRYGI